LAAFIASNAHVRTDEGQRVAIFYSKIYGQLLLPEQPEKSRQIAES
jgi:hypothetical protein